MARSKSKSRRHEPPTIVVIFSAGLLSHQRAHVLEKAALELLGRAIDDAASSWAWEIRRIGEGRKDETYIEFVWHRATGDERRPLPRGAVRWSVADFGRYRGTCTLVEDFDAFRGEHPRLTLEGALAAFAKRRRGWMAARGLRLSEDTYRRYKRRIDPVSPDFDGNVDGRGRRLGASRRRWKRASERRGK